MSEDRIAEYLEIEKLRHYNGAYAPAFFSIDLPVVEYFDKIADYSRIDELGIFVHEYIHYIQNITTYNGMFWSLVEYRKMADIIRQIKDAAPGTLTLPMKIRDADIDALGDRFQFCYRGYEKDISLIIDSDEWQIRWPTSNVYGRVYKVPHITDLKTGGSFVLSTWHIKESMAFMYQSLIDPNIENDKTIPNIPYRVIQFLCKRNYPSLYNDSKKLICICFIALQFECPGHAIFGILDFARDHPELDGQQLILNSYINDRVNYDNKQYTLKEFFHETVNKFKRGLQETVGNIDFLDRILTKADEGKDLNAMMSILYTDDGNPGINMTDLQMSKDFYEIPYLMDYSKPFIPKSTNDANIDAEDICRLLSMYSVYCSVTKPVGADHQCPFHRECMIKGSDPIICMQKPWLNEACHYRQFADEIGLLNKLKSEYLT